MLSKSFSMSILMFVLFLPLVADAEEDYIPQFTDFPVSNTYTREHVAVVLSTPEEREFRTRLREASKQPVNFAGEYVLTKWGCGNSCTHGAVVSLQTGHVVFLPGTVGGWEWDGEDGSESDIETIMFRKNSRLLVASGFINDGGVYGMHYYEFTGKSFKHLTTVPVQRD